MKNVLVYGTGKSGKSAANLLVRQGYTVILFDENKDLDKDKFYKENIKLENVKIVLGDISDDLLKEIDTAVISPGISLEKENVVKLINAGKKIIGELELGFMFEKGRVVAITGTNGKTTTTSLVGHILKDSLKKVYVAGNIGDPYTDICDETDENSVTVLEVSSFQLETAHTFKPVVSAILNITPDHLDRHKTFENYANMKKSITKNQGEGDLCVLNKEDKLLEEFAKEAPCKVRLFSAKEKIDGLYFHHDKIFLQENNFKSEIIDIHDLQILGEHNYENVMAAVSMCLALGVKLSAIKESLKTFKAVEHRIEFVCEKDGITFYNDSKATNTDAAIKGLLAMIRPVVLIGGGYDKKGDYAEWVKLFKGRVSKLILIGQTAKDIALCADANGFDNYVFASNLEEAVVVAKNLAQKGECVLLSPACASWGQFKNFEERGRLFKEYVLNN